VLNSERGEPTDNGGSRKDDRSRDSLFSIINPRLSAIYISIVVLLIASFTFASQARSRSRLASTTPRATGALKVFTGHPESVVFINNIRHGATNEKGELDLPHVFAGNFIVRVRTVGYIDWSGSVVIAAGGSRTLRVTQQSTTDEATLCYQRGEALRDKGKNKDAVERFKQALALKPSLAEARISMARSLIALQDFQEAEKQLQAAIRLGGHAQIEAQTVLGNLRRNQGLADESIVEYRKAIRLARGNAFEAHIGLAIALNEQSQSRADPRLIDEIAREYRIGILQDMETEPILYYQLGEILEKAGRVREAIEAYRSYLRLDPEGEYASAVESIIARLKEENR
jgi:tetratricopeptide (TPR) repeat protein